MPQLVFGDYPPQLVWLVITFGLLLFVMARLVMPRVGAILEQREHHIQSDLDRAERLKTDADATLAAYHRSIAEARVKAQADLREAQAAMAADAAARDAALTQQLAQRTKAAEDSIATAKTRALTDLRGVGTEVARSVLAKVGGVDIPAPRVEAAIDAALAERR